MRLPIPLVGVSTMRFEVGVWGDWRGFDTDRDLKEPEGWRSSSLRKILL